MENPNENEEITIKSLATESPYYQTDFMKVELLGGSIEDFSFTKEGLKVKLLDNQDLAAPLVLKIH